MKFQASGILKSIWNSDKEFCTEILNDVPFKRKTRPRRWLSGKWPEFESLASCKSKAKQSKTELNN